MTGPYCIAGVNKGQRKRIFSALSQRRAVAAVEVALVAPLLCTIVLGLCEVSRAVMVKAALSDAARDGCRAGIARLASNSTITNKIKSVLTANNLSATDATITIQVNGQTADASTAKSGNKISVKVSLPYAKAAWSRTFFFLSGQSLASETVVMLRQG